MDPTIAVLGLGYVGLPLAIEFARHFRVIGFDVDCDRVVELTAGIDRTREVDEDALGGAHFTCQAADLREASVYIVAVPTPVDEHKRPDLRPLLEATRLVGGALRPGDLVIYESTVYPGCTEEDCIPVLEETSGLQLNADLFLGYSPERINPGDRTRRLGEVVKIVSAANPETLERVEQLYATIVPAGIHRAPSIRVAEAAKVIENTNEM